LSHAVVNNMQAPPMHWHTHTKQTKNALTQDETLITDRHLLHVHVSLL